MKRIVVCWRSPWCCGGAGRLLRLRPAAPKVVKVAILAPLSGPVPTFGVSTRDGALLAIEEWNAKGGVLKKKIEPIVEDSQCTPDPAVNAANKVIDQDKVQVHHRRGLLQGFDPGLRDRQRQEGASRSAPPPPTRR